MSIITYQPSKEKQARIENLAQARGISIHDLIDEAMTMTLAKNDIETQFNYRASKGDINAGIALLDKVLAKRDIHDKSNS